MRLSRNEIFKNALSGLAIVLAIFAIIYTMRNKTPIQPASPATKTSTDVKKDTPPSNQPVTTVATPEAAAAKTKNLYYPSSLPANYQPNNDFEIIGDNTVDYSITDDAGNKYFVLEQPIASAADLDNFEKSLTHTEPISTPAGKALIGNRSSELLGSIRTADNLWILISAPDAKLRPQLQALLQSLKPYKSP